jgi:hypothetical protein
MLDASQYESVVLDQYRFRGLHGREAWCALEILHASRGRTVVIATEIKDNPGASITNAWEQLAYGVCVDFAIDPSKLVWIEHYGYPSPSGPNQPRTYDFVTFTVLPPGHDAVLARPSWRPMHDEDWRELGLEPRSPGP